MTNATHLTRNQDLVFQALVDAAVPLSAYTILDRLRESGLRAPLQVYRALEALREKGLVHRLESLNAFVACARPDCQRHETVAFAICDQCNHVSEFFDADVEARLNAWVRGRKFLPERTTIEIRGTCKGCAG